MLSLVTIQFGGARAVVVQAVTGHASIRDPARPPPWLLHRELCPCGLLGDKQCSCQRPSEKSRPLSRPPRAQKFRHSARSLRPPSWLVPRQRGNASHSPWGGAVATAVSGSLLCLHLSVGTVSSSPSQVGEPRALMPVNTPVSPWNWPTCSGPKCSKSSYLWGLCRGLGLTISFSVIHASHRPQPVLVVFSGGVVLV